MRGIGHRNILCDMTERLVERNLLPVRTPGHRSRQHFTDLALDMIFLHPPGFDGVTEFACLRQRMHARIRDVIAPRHRLIIHFARRAQAGADQIDMLAGLQPLAMDQRLLRSGVILRLDHDSGGRR